MNTRQKFSLFILIVVLGLAALACNLVSNITDPVSEVIDEAQQIVTQVGEIATQVNVEELSATVEALATEMPIDLEGLQATAEAIGAGLQSGEAPANVPLVEGEKVNFYATETVVSYFTDLPLAEVLAFYKEQMPLNGWDPVDAGTIETSAAAVLNFENPTQTAAVTLSTNPVNDQTVVLVTLSSR